MSDIVERLRGEWELLSGFSIDRGSVDAGISANLAAEAADRIEALDRELDESVPAPIEEGARIADDYINTLLELQTAQAEASRLREALAQARIWHEAEDKALSKQPPSHGPNGNQWARLQHQEQMAEIDAALSSGSKT